MEENEIWKDVECYNGIYKISSLGNVIRFKANRWVRVKSWKNTNGYNQVSLSRDGAREVRLVHRLVANAFIPNPNNYSCINHIDEVRDNNIVSNLEWCTYKMNDNHGTRNEKIKRSAEFCHLKYYYSKYDENGRLVKKYDTVRQLRKDGHNVRNIRTSIRKGWKSNGFYWKKELIN